MRALDPSRGLSFTGNKVKSRRLSPDGSMELATPLGQAPARSLVDRFGQPDPPRPGRGTHTWMGPLSGPTHTSVLGRLRRPVLLTQTSAIRAARFARRTRRPSILLWLALAPSRPPAPPGSTTLSRLRPRPSGRPPPQPPTRRKGKRGSATRPMSGRDARPPPRGDPEADGAKRDPRVGSHARGGSTSQPTRRPGYLVAPASNICLSQRFSHAGLSAHGRYSETANGSLNQLWFL